MKIQQMWHTSSQLLVLFTKCVCNRSVMRYRCFKLPRKNIVMGHQWGCCHLSLDKSLTALHYRPGVKTVVCNAAPACPCSPVCLQFLSGNTWIWVDLVCSRHPSDKNNPCSYNHYFFSPLLHTHKHTSTAWPNSFALGWESRDCALTKRTARLPVDQWEQRHCSWCE